MATTEVKYLLSIPESLIQKIRLLSVERKNQKAEVKTQKAIMIELLEAGLAYLEGGKASG